MVRDREGSDVALEAHHFALLQNRNNIANSVLWKRKEQLRKWENSETNRMPSVRNLSRDLKVKFTNEDIFLSACLSGDFDEVQKLLEDGSDINTCTVDGLTALHQAVIDGKPTMVQFLIEHGANINAQDNEGWTPLHAAACCGNLELVEYLCSEGADISVTNSEKELAVDLAEEDDCRSALEAEHQRQGIELNECRNRELILMRRDAEQWLKDGEIRERPHPRTGATALHVAAAKGYTDVMRLLLKAGADVNCRDRDGWTPLHAAAHWAEHEAAAILLQNGATFNELTNSGETVLNVADKEIVEYLEGMQEKERLKLASNNSLNVLLQPNTPLKRAGSTTSVLRMSTEDKTKKTKLDEQDENKDLREGRYSLIIEEKTPSPSVEVRLPFPFRQQREQSESLSEEERLSSKSSTEDGSEEKSLSLSDAKGTTDTEKDSASDSTLSDAEQREMLLSNGHSPYDSAADTKLKQMELKFEKNDIEFIDRKSSATSNSASSANSDSVSRSVSVESSSSSGAPTQKQIIRSVTEKEKSSTAPSEAVRPIKPVGVQHITPITWMPLYRNAAVKSQAHPAFAYFQAAVRQTSDFVSRSRPLELSATEPSAPSKRISLATPPTEPNMPNESEAERRSKAKRQRDSRRSTQGVTREQLRAAVLSVRREEKESGSYQKVEANMRSSSSPSLESTPSDEIEKRAMDAKNLDIKQPSVAQALSAVRRRSQVPKNSRRVTGPIYVDDFKGTESSSEAQKLGPSVQSSVVDGNTPTTSQTVINSPAPLYTHASLTVKANPVISQVHSNVGMQRPLSIYNSTHRTAVQESVDYKALYEKEKHETERLRKLLEELTLEKTNNNLTTEKRGAARAPSVGISKSLSATPFDDRERRAYEQRIAEMQYEIEQLEHLRTDNEKLKEENGALIRVISKLSK